VDGESRSGNDVSGGYLHRDDKMFVVLVIRGIGGA
jgi:hypothetical protein